MELDGETQLGLCRRFKAEFLACASSEKAGVALNVRTALLPINGLRHNPAAGASGWYIWAGEEFSDKDDFFVPLHLGHLSDWRPEVVRFLGLAPGWRFLVADGYEDVWFDETLLDD